ncbi:MAG TPA: hypothetical protein PKD15_04295 [Candidatus Saccharibacteria bacterium]|nr:hypothetical protein [Candidatus Saccharibacteria bacterium]
MPFAEQELAHEAKRRMFYDPLIIRQLERKLQTPLAVTAYEASARDQLDKQADSALFDTGICGLIGGIATFFTEVMSSDNVWDFSFSADAKACVFGVTAIAVAGFMEFTTSHSEN